MYGLSGCGSSSSNDFEETELAQKYLTQITLKIKVSVIVISGLCHFKSYPLHHFSIVLPAQTGILTLQLPCPKTSTP
jgi:hypothetical protein